MPPIVLLEDDPKVTKFITTMLQFESYEVESFSRIDQLIDVLQYKNYDILIMDRMIEGCDAISWIKRIKNLAPNMKILIVSALSSNADRIKSFGLGVDDYLEKPFLYEELSCKLKNLLPSSPKNAVLHDLTG